ncbi:response regulator [Fredinandcohnia sp. SECRCQ15]|uniref:Response regulator n=1 Tax=Fredinandcohnia quinoae TaxID=2918902 RepID=A0AAW5EBJ8_9BACI|nr:response regulator [Fredinandcohnia sp. SECRCQ15]
MKVIIVDDEVLERRALSSIISNEFSEIEVIGEAPNGRIAIEMAQEHRPHMMLMDIKMPGIDGVEAVREIKKTYPDIKFIMVSAFNTFEYAKEVMLQGVKEYILKPSRKEDIIESVQRVLTEIKEEKKKMDQQEDLHKQMKRLIALSPKEGLASIGMVEPNVDIWKDNHTKAIMEKAKSYIEDNFRESLTLEEVAEHVELSPFYFSKLFKDRFGVTFIDFVTTVRMNYAMKEMADATKSLKEICYTIGYKDPNYFSRVFKKHTGFTPTEYRSSL